MKYIVAFLLALVTWFALGFVYGVTYQHARVIHCYGMGEDVSTPGEYPVYRMECDGANVLYVD